MPKIGRTRAPAKPAALRTYGIAPLIDGAAALESATSALRALDPERIGPMLAVTGSPPLRLRPPGFAGLATIVVSQQVSTASAAAIFGRLEQVVAPLTAGGLLLASDAVLLQAGLSNAKVRTLRAVAEALVSGALSFEDLARLPADEAHRRLCAIKGIGPWTADVFLLFCLGHPDALPAGDIALQEGARLALGLERRPDAAGLEALAEPWRPYRGVAARLLWAYYRVRKQGRSGIALEGETGPAAVVENQDDPR